MSDGLPLIHYASTASL